jgi:hypothetical protein
MDIRVLDMGWYRLVPVRVQWIVAVKMVMNIRVPSNIRAFLSS